MYISYVRRILSINTNCSIKLNGLSIDGFAGLISITFIKISNLPLPAQRAYKNSVTNYLFYRGFSNSLVSFNKINNYVLTYLIPHKES